MKTATGRIQSSRRPGCFCRGAVDAGAVSGLLAFLAGSSRAVACSRTLRAYSAPVFTPAAPAKNDVVALSALLPNNMGEIAVNVHVIVLHGADSQEVVERK